MSEVAAHLNWLGNDQLQQAQFFAEGMHCVNCARAIRTQVGALPGVNAVDVNLTTTRVSVSWNPARATLGSVLKTVERLGFKPVPLSGSAAAAERQSERRQMQKRIGLTGLVAMQMSMYTVGLYLGVAAGIDPWIERLLRVTAMLLAVPVMWYAGAPFLAGAARDLRQGRLGMDVPVSTALLLAFGASVANTWRDSGQIYFDSVAMFIFFLLIGRYVEMSVRRGSLDAGEALLRTLPTFVTRLRADGGSERIELQQIASGDRLLVAHGAVVPVDATLAEGTTLTDESLISGESMAVTRGAGSGVPGGALNLGAPCILIASQDLRGSTLTQMVALIERAQSERAPATQAADRAAKNFVLWIMLLSVAVALAWLYVDPQRAFAATLSVLVVTCPCALSLATPVALAAATLRLARRGIVVTHADALDRLSAVDTVVLDKTGTLTGPGVQLGQTHCHGSYGRTQCLSIAASLEQHSLHPLASAFTGATTRRQAVSEIQETAGYGLQGVVEGVLWRLGRRDFVAQLAAPGTLSTPGLDELTWLGSQAGFAASFELEDTLRSDAASALEELRSLGLELRIASGDRRGTVENMARSLGVAHAEGRMTPAAKQRLVSGLQQQGRAVLMIGDGINDGPVLAAAHVSAAMGGGAAIAHAAVDLLLMNESLGSVAVAVRTARAAQRLVRANLRWAMAYNLLAVPLAALGLVPPWLAALGMSASSMFVVWRARRFAGLPT